MTIRFYLHTYQRTDGNRPIYLDVRWGRGTAAGDTESRLRTSSGQSCHPKNWNEDKQRIKSAETGYAKANNKLADLERNAGRLIEQAELDGTILTAEDLLAQLQLVKPTKRKPVTPKPVAVPATVRTLADVYADWKSAYRARLAAKTLSNPQGLISRLAEWRPTQPAVPQEFQPDAHGRCRPLEDFCTWLVEEARLNGKNGTKRERGLYNNTISSYLKQLRKLLKFERLPADWIEDSFSEEIERDPLTFEEVMQLYRHEPLEIKEGSTNYTPRRHVRDVFVFNCLTGPRYSDLVRLKPSDLTLETFKAEDGSKRQVPVLAYDQQKIKRDKTKVRVALDPIAYEIWQRYKGKLPVPSNKHMVATIKILCRAAGLKRKVTHVRGRGAERISREVELWQVVSCHSARYTFITLQFEGGADVVFIQDSVGHANLNTTRGYLKTRLKDRHTSTLAAFDRLRQDQDA
ncbi:tyrosine-type recombinase/integrase [Hymenobacter sp. AT01-02]|uniref:tyrosine-type recombinase/integrase n=1 Tax=Hymenobacter sp. AT01-02 TaxID=1571877 RepID=UPI0005F257BD|nr:tyrosine-type recombinase/integrase [Hymenobacter sp. AT01-02]